MILVSAKHNAQDYSDINVELFIEVFAPKGYNRF